MGGGWWVVGMPLPRVRLALDAGDDGGDAEERVTIGLALQLPPVAEGI